ncbi:hypothetical protein PCANC_26032 [Puccinia coronata f. sp. avenae]|uniref:Uncharacterized protein n=1 Tax=Puccinia coronata f. sp. avenae TaxID=200324 RepID=A0A2N5S6F2_9BASI|nr:hypothetical protein PCANC_26032 [Puccinia coronata f. sp. avenae]
MTLCSLGLRRVSLAGRTAARGISTTRQGIAARTNAPAAAIVLATSGGSSSSSTTRKPGSRTYPLRKQFIFESYLHLFTANHVCLLFRHQDLTCAEWNSIRGKIKNLAVDKSQSSPPDSSVPFAQFTFKPDSLHASTIPPPKIEVLRTKMILPVLKSLLKQSMISRKTYDALIYPPRPPVKPSSPSSALDTATAPRSEKRKKEKQVQQKNLTGSLFALSQAEFNPGQIKQVLEIINTHLAKSSPSETAPSKKEGSSETQNDNQKKKIQFLVGFIHQSICKDDHDLKQFSNLNSLQTSRSQIVSLIGRFGSDLLFNLNLARASQLLTTLTGFQKTLQDQAAVHPPSPPTESSSNPSTPTE